jgi:hypothetical protein
MSARRWLLFGFVSTAIAACGSRTGLLVPVHHDASTEDAADVTDAAREPDVFAEEPDADAPGEGDVATEPDVGEDAPVFFDAPDLCPDAGSTLIYLIANQNTLMSFYPPTLSFTTIGDINCNDPAGGAPFSMAVNRAGIAYVVFNSGNLFRVSTLTASCRQTSFNPSAVTFPVPFGMGFSADSPDAGTDGGETLYVAGDLMSGGGPGPSSLGWIDTTSFQLNVVGLFKPTIIEPELTGTGAGDLYGFWAPNGTSDTAIVQIDKTTGTDTPVAPLPGVTFGSGWAFAFWGGDFYLFTAPGSAGGTSIVTRYRPSDGSIVQVATAPAGMIIVGAGVSTCAPEM